MGEVWLSEDGLIGREVALKVLRQSGDGPRARFVTEVQIAGRLEHPGIVPVHDMGEDDQGRPFYVMKFVRGQTLKTAILAYHARAADADDDGGAREVQWVRLLKVFIDLCHAIGYAHSRGVLHRDLKPDNVMLGPFGETLLLDWGLAKLVGEADADGNGLSGRASGTPWGASSHTGDGTVMGTPTYMAPEMAEGRAADVDQRTDVYLLGATLYEIVTGRAPRSGNSRDELIELARSTLPAPPRKLARGCPRPLEAVILKAMALRKENRYAGAMELAEDVHRYLAGEAVSACREPLPARALRWCRRHRRGLARAAAAAMLIGLAAYGTRQVRRAEHRRLLAETQAAELSTRERARRDVLDILRLADEARFYAASTDPVGERAPYFDPATGRGAARAAFDIAGRWGAGLRQLPLHEERGRVRGELYDLALLIAQSHLGNTADRRAGLDAMSALEQATAFAPDPPDRGYHRLRASAYRAIGDEPRATAEEHLSRDEPRTAAEWFLEGERHRTSVREASDPAERGQRDVALGRAVGAYREALHLQPAHFWTWFQLGRCYLSLGRRGEAVEALGACVALRPDSPWGYSARGLALALLRRFPEAEADLDRAVKLPGDFRPARLNRGVVYLLQKQHDRALTEFAAAMAPPEQAMLVEAAYYRGLLLDERGDHALACEDFGRVLLRRPEFRPALVARAKSYLMRGDRNRCLDDLTAAAAATDAGQTDPADPAFLSRRGRLLRAVADGLPWPTASEALELARHDLQEAVRRGGPSPSPSLFAELVDVTKLLRRREDALTWCSKAIEAAPTDPRHRVARGNVYYELDRYAEAQADFEEAVHHDPGNADARAMLACVRARQSASEDALREAAYALVACRRGDYLVLHNVACVFAELSRPGSDKSTAYQDLAVALLRRAVELWREGGAGLSELELIRAEPAFVIPSLWARPDFQQLFTARQTTPSNRVRGDPDRR
jgi:tetratricopeptide (TPR) repeat protein